MRTPSGSTVSLVLSAFTIACSDSTTSLTQHASYAQLQDGEINQSDSHFMTNVSLSQSITIDSSESFPHPETGEPTTSYTYTQPTIGLYVEGGYDNAGRTRINLRVDSDPGNDEPAEHRVGYMKQIDDAPYHYVATGAPLENEYNMDAPMSDLGTLVDVTYESVVGYQPPSGGGGGGGGGGELMSVVGGIPTRTTLTRLSNRRLRVVREGEFREGGLTLFSLADKKTTTKEERLYEHDGNEYVLRERTLESEESFAGGSTKLKQRMVLEDEVPAQQGQGQGAESPARREGEAGSWPLPVRNSAGVRREHGHHPRRGGVLIRRRGGSSGGSGGCVKTTQVLNGGGSKNLVMQHGIMSNNCTWARLHPHVNSTFSIGNTLIPSLASFDRYQSQADALRGSMGANFPGQAGFVVISHSQGGVISRRAAHDGSGGLIDGILTIGTPHGGAPFARTATLVSALVTIGRLAIAAVKAPVNFAPLRTAIEQDLGNCFIVGAACDARPGSSFFDQLNSEPESFRRTAVVDRARRTWLLYRLTGDFLCGAAETTDSNCGASAVRRAGSLEKRMIKCAVIGGLLPVVGTGAALACGATIVAMRGLDYGWRLAISSDAVSDGFIPAWSQVYPNTPFQQFFVENGPSHVGETLHNRVRTEVDRALRDVFEVPARE